MMELILKKQLEDTYISHKHKIKKFIKSKISDIEEAEDILQDVFVQAVKNVNVLQSIDNLIGWLYTVANNMVIDWYRKKRLKTVSIQKEYDDTTLEGLIKDTGINLEKDMVKKIIMEELIEAIDNLPEDQKDIIIKQAIEGKTFNEISLESGISINTLLARKRYALASLREMLKDLKEVLSEIK